MARLPVMPSSASQSGPVSRPSTQVAMVTQDGPHPTVRVKPTVRPDNGVVIDGRAQHAMHSSPEGLYDTKREERRTLTVRR